MRLIQTLDHPVSIAILVVVLAEVTVLIVGGVVDGHWWPAKVSAVLGAAWVADQLLWKRANSARIGRISLGLIAATIGLLALDQIRLWT